MKIPTKKKTKNWHHHTIITILKRKGFINPNKRKRQYERNYGFTARYSHNKTGQIIHQKLNLIKLPQTKNLNLLNLNILDLISLSIRLDYFIHNFVNDPPCRVLGDFKVPVLL